MGQSHEIKYFLISENKEGMGAIHKQALCHMAYATALETLGVTAYLTSEQISKYADKKTTLIHHGDELEFAIKVPIKRELNAYDLMQQAQKDVQQHFADFLAINVKQVNIIVDQVVF